MNNIPHIHQNMSDNASSTTSLPSSQLNAIPSMELRIQGGRALELIFDYNNENSTRESFRWHEFESYIRTTFSDGGGVSDKHQALTSNLQCRNYSQLHDSIGTYAYDSKICEACVKYCDLLRLW